VLLAVLCTALFLLPFKVAAEGGKGAGASLGALLFVGLLFAPWALQRHVKSEPEKRRATVSLAWKLGLAGALGNLAQGYAFDSIHPGVASTFIQLNALFVALLGSLWLAESLRAVTAFGIALALLGIVVAQWPAITGNFDWNWGIFWAVLAAFAFSIMDLASRRDSRDADSVVSNVLRSWLAMLLLALMPGVLRQFLSMGPLEVGACALAALLGPGLGRGLLISASRELPAAESALLQQLLPPLALPLTSVVFGTWPTKWEWWGSVLVGAGVVLPLLYTYLSTRERMPRRSIK
jgi:drug/metabolite transporter (DMT)-like permease